MSRISTIVFHSVADISDSYFGTQKKIEANIDDAGTVKIKLVSQNIFQRFLSWAADCVGLNYEGTTKVMPYSPPVGIGLKLEHVILTEEAVIGRIFQAVKNDLIQPQQLETLASAFFSKGFLDAQNVVKDAAILERNEALSIAKEAVVRGDIPLALQQIASSLQKDPMPLSGLELCQIFDIREDSLALSAQAAQSLGVEPDLWKGISTIQKQNAIMFSEHSDPEALNNSIESVQQLLENFPRGFIFFKPDSQELYFLRKKGDAEVECYDQKQKVWKDFSANELKALNLRPDDWCISLGTTEKFPAHLETTHATPTPQATRAPGDFFYQEHQTPTSGNYCGIHAVNAFMGRSAVALEEFFNFAHNFMIKQLNLSPETIYAQGSSLVDVRAGTDPKLLKEYIETQAQKGLFPREFATLKYEQVKLAKHWKDDLLKQIPLSCNRVIIGYGGSHFATARYDEEDQRWYLVDSLEDNSQNFPYHNLEELLKNSPRTPLVDTISVMYPSS